MTPKEFLDAIKDGATDEARSRATAALESPDSEIRTWLNGFVVWARKQFLRVRRPDHLLGFDIDSALEEVALRDPQLAGHTNAEGFGKPDELVARLAEFCRGMASPEAAASLAAELQDRGSRASHLIQSVAGKGTDSTLDQAVVNSDARGRFTPREWKILQLVANGESVKGMSEILGLTQKTIHAHIASLLRKVRLHDTSESASVDLVIFCMRAREMIT
ncbi:DNA-binding transcriptional activator UhpA [Phycisphaerae bacterium RAS1]|nr:DNA-binding transcriptional activator UhpA [Phycisphaerae bacterium RAS1]